MSISELFVPNLDKPDFNLYVNSIDANSYVFPTSSIPSSSLSATWTGATAPTVVPGNKLYRLGNINILTLNAFPSTAESSGAPQATQIGFIPALNVPAGTFTVTQGFADDNGTGVTTVVQVMNNGQVVVYAGGTGATANQPASFSGAGNLDFEQMTLVWTN